MLLTLTAALVLVSQAGGFVGAQGSPRLGSTPSVIAPLTLSSPNPQTGGVFGAAVGVSASTTVVGAAGESVSGLLEAGHAYLFSSKTGALRTTLTSPNVQADGLFGTSVAVSGKLVLVGAPGEAVLAQNEAGRAYLYTASGTLVTTLVSPDPQTGGLFGDRVAMSGSLVAVAAPFEAVAGQPEAGDVYVFQTDGTLLATLDSPKAAYYGGDDGALFGIGLALSGSTLVVGAPLESAPGAGGAGHAYIFKATTGKVLATLTSPSPSSDGEFGYSVAVGGQTVVVGALGETASGQRGAGHVYTFARSTGAGLSTLSSPNASVNGSFGYSVAVYRTTILVGANNETGAGFVGAGLAYNFTLAGSLLATLVSQNPQVPIVYGTGFGSAVALSGSYQVVGAPGEGAGHAYLYP